MFRLTRWMVVVAVAAVFLVAKPSCVFACSCLAPGSPAEELAKSQAVFAGKVVERTPNVVDGANPVMVTFEVSQAWKGAPNKTVRVTTPGSSASCGVDLTPGQEYLVYAGSDEAGGLQVTLCSRTNLLSSAADDVAALGAGQAPADDMPSQLPDTGDKASADGWTTYGLLGLGIVGAGLLVALAQRQIGRRAR